ncbi:ATP-NAD kinase [Apiospora hydei]|uniref:ATP-NAD kinase n=1 Tax=Apiospora hydei TaxID=1337664 RepID=A0ABR1X2S9_9PEZI
MAGLVTSPTALHPALSNPSDGGVMSVPEASNKSSSIPDGTRGSPDALADRPTLPPPSSSTSSFFESAQHSGNDQQSDAFPSESSVAGLTGPHSSKSSHFSPRMYGHHKNTRSVESVPRQTIMKALASVARNNKPEALSLTGMLSAHSGPEARPSSSSSQRLSEALNELASRNTPPPPHFLPSSRPASTINGLTTMWISTRSWRRSRMTTGCRILRRPIRRAVRNVMIVTKARDNELVYLTRELAMWLLRTPRYGSDVGVNVYVDAKLRTSKRFGATSLIEDDPRFETMLRYWSPDLCWSQPEKFDLVLTLGGDGTVLFTSWLFQRVVPPVLSFSLGSLGFLTSFEFEKYKQHLNRIMGEEGMRVNLRMRFTCTVYRHGANGAEAEEGEQFEVLNELVIDRGPSPYVSNLELYGDNELLTIVQADGCIFSTPTGSTAYSLSAGGSLVHPDIPAILLTPICPHTLSFRPMVLSDTLLLRVSVPRNSRATAYCAFDGKGRVELKQGDYVTISASQYPLPTKGFETKDGEEMTKEEEPEWDIDTDSACYASEDGSTSASPLRRQMSLLGM